MDRGEIKQIVNRWLRPLESICTKKAVDCLVIDLATAIETYHKEEVKRILEGLKVNPVMAKDKKSGIEIPFIPTIIINQAIKDLALVPKTSSLPKPIKDLEK